MGTPIWYRECLFIDFNMLKETLRRSRQPGALDPTPPIVDKTWLLSWCWKSPPSVEHQIPHAFLLSLWVMEPFLTSCTLHKTGQKWFKTNKLVENCVQDGLTILKLIENLLKMVWMGWNHSYPVLSCTNLVRNCLRPYLLTKIHKNRPFLFLKKKEGDCWNGGQGRPLWKIRFRNPIGAVNRRRPCHRSPMDPGNPPSVML